MLVVFINKRSNCLTTTVKLCFVSLLARFNTEFYPRIKVNMNVYVNCYVDYTNLILVDKQNAVFLRLDNNRLINHYF